MASDDEAAPVEECIVFVRAEGALQIELRDFTGSCGLTFEGAAEHANGTLVLKARNAHDDCVIARCSGCRYDLRFDIESVPVDEKLTLRVEIGGCGDESGDEGSREPRIETLTLPLHEKAQGTWCRTLGQSDVGWHER